MSVRGDILDSLATQLATITTANGYPLNVGSVLRDVPHSENIRPDPGDTVCAIDDTGVDRIVGRFLGDKVLAVVTVIVRGYVGSYRDVGPENDTKKLIAGLKQLIDAPISLGANARYAEWTDIESIVRSDLTSIIAMAVEIVYWYETDAP